MFTVAQMEHQLKSKMSLRSEFLFKIFVFNTIGHCNFSNFLCIIGLNTPHPPILFKNFKKKVLEWYGGASHTYLTTELLTRREDDRTYIQ